MTGRCGPASGLRPVPRQTHLHVSQRERSPFSDVVRSACQQQQQQQRAGGRAGATPFAVLMMLTSAATLRKAAGQMGLAAWVRVSQLCRT